jgi:hypothetical protein
VLHVAVGDGAIVLGVVGEEGKRALRADEITAGIRERVDDRLTDRVPECHRFTMLVDCLDVAVLIPRSVKESGVKELAAAARDLFRGSGEDRVKVVRARREREGGTGHQRDRCLHGASF